MSCTLNGITLHDQSRWLDEFAWSGIQRNQSLSLNGNLITQASAKNSGRPITIDCKWLNRATLTQLEALRDSITTTEFTLILPGPRSFECAFAAVAEPISVTPLQPRFEYEDEDLFAVTIYLVTTAAIVSLPVWEIPFGDDWDKPFEEDWDKPFD